MGIVRRLGRPITGATRPQNRPQQIKQGGGGLAAQSQIAAPPAPFQNPLGSANFQRNRTNDAATQGVGDGQSRNTANVSGGQPMSDGQVLRGAGYTKPINYAGYKVHDVTTHRFGSPAPRGRQASEVTRGRNTTGRKPLYKRESNADIFGEGAKLYRERHGSI